MSRRRTRSLPEPNVPVFNIDLSMSPRERYKSLASQYQPQIKNLIPLFDALLADLGIPNRFHLPINHLARLLLRGVHSPIETAELRGVRDITGVSMYLLVAFNVVLDLLMGCTSGGVRSLETDQPTSEARMLHFRTLDWGMDPLRSIIVQLNFIRSKSDRPDHVIASSITYVGFVGVLTGVRPKLSMSLNFRAVHNATTRGAHVRFYLHHLLVLLGLRQSISSLLRGYLYSESSAEDERATDIGTIARQITPQHTTAAYLVFSNGESTLAMEKDFSTAVVRQSSSFIVATNHDINENPSDPKAATPAGDAALPGAPTRAAAGLQELLDESMDRMECISKKWDARMAKAHRDARKQKLGDNGNIDEVDSQVSIPKAEVVRWVCAWPTTNECTHFAAVLDAKRGRVVWARAYEEPVRQPRASDLRVEKLPEIPYD